MKISNLADCIEPSLTRELFNRAAKLDDVINLTLGDPDLPPPQNVRDAACAAIQAGKTRYSANAGLVELRRAIAASFLEEYGQACDATSEVMVSVGGMEALYLALSAIIDPGDEVVIFGPYYVNYVQMVRMNGGVPVIIDTEEEDGFSVDPALLESRITDKTVAIIVNTPCNPTGAMLPKNVLEAIAAVAKTHDLYIIADEVYKSLVYGEELHHSVLEVEGMRDRTILIDSLSKKFAMTGWRLGWAIGPKTVIAAMTKMQENVAACAALPSQYAAIEALSDRTDVSYIRDAFVGRRDLIYRQINACEKLSARKPLATFYIFVNIEKTGFKSLDFAIRLLESEHVAVVPGLAYGKSYDNFIRIAFTHDIKVLKEACVRIQRFVNRVSITKRSLSQSSQSQ